MNGRSVQNSSRSKYVRAMVRRVVEAKKVGITRRGRSRIMFLEKIKDLDNEKGITMIEMKSLIKD